VTGENQLDDIEAVYNFARANKQIDYKRFAVLGHSEGSINLARLIREQRINSTAVMFIGGVTESPKSILRYQIAERPVDWAFAMDVNNDGVLTNAEMKEGYLTSAMNGYLPLENILSPDGSWTRERFQKEFDALYEMALVDAAQKKENDTFEQSGVVYASMNWWKQWFTDESSVLENLKNFTGPIEYHNGTIDSQTPGLRELDFLKNSKIQMQSVPNFKVHPGKGHGLGIHSLYGPMDEAIADEVVATLKSLLVFVLNETPNPKVSNEAK
jgi:hypothetical protein